MLRINLATRPLYNEDAVRFAVILVLFIGLTGLVGAVIEIAGLSKRYVAFETAGKRDEEIARTLVAEAVGARERADGGKVLVEARDKAKSLIERRVFSWTRFFGLIEQSIPADVMLTSVRPDIANSEMTVRIGVVGRGISDIGFFIEELEATGNFLDILVREEEVLDEGGYRALLVGQYSN